MGDDGEYIAETEVTNQDQRNVITAISRRIAYTMHKAFSTLRDDLQRWRSFLDQR